MTDRKTDGSYRKTYRHTRHTDYSGSKVTNSIDTDYRLRLN